MTTCCPPPAAASRLTRVHACAHGVHSAMQQAMKQSNISYYWYKANDQLGLIFSDTTDSHKHT